MNAAAAPGNGYKPTAGARITLAMLCFVYVLNFLDRQLISILAKPIQDGLHITDSELGLLTGLYFALFYCFIAIPIGWLADRTSRVKVLAAACAIWSSATRRPGPIGARDGHHEGGRRRRGPDGGGDRACLQGP